MLRHCIQQLIVCQSRVGKTKLGEKFFLLANQSAHGTSHSLGEFDQPFTAGRRFQILDHDRIFAALADHGERVAGCATCGIVKDRDGQAEVSGSDILNVATRSATCSFVRPRGFMPRSIRYSFAVSSNSSVANTAASSVSPATTGP